MKPEINLNRKVHAGISLALVVLIGIGIVSYRSTVEFAESADKVARSHRIIALLQSALANVVSVESEARGYTITGHEKYLELYRTALDDLNDDMKELRRLATDLSVRAHLVDLERLTKLRLERLQVTIETRRLEGFDALPKGLGPGKQIMDELRSVVSDMEARQNELLAERDRHSQQLARRTLAVVTGGTVFTLVLALISSWILTSDLRHRERLEREVLAISEREQRRIGQDLHDGVCQHLTGISLFSRSLQQKLAGRHPAEAAEAARITELINDSIEQTRQVTRGLHPVPDEADGLVLALRELAEYVKSHTKLECRFECPEPVTMPDQGAATHLYRIAQEAVQNALRHAKATALTIKLTAREESISLSIADDGRGLPEQATGTGMGMEIMKYRAANIGAQLEIGPNRPRGTLIACTLPRSSLS